MLAPSETDGRRRADCLQGVEDKDGKYSILALTPLFIGRISRSIQWESYSEHIGCRCSDWSGHGRGLHTM